MDFPKDLYIAWRLSEGDLLYQQVRNWYGPLAHLLEGFGFQVFGVGYLTLVGMNILLTLGVLLLVRAIFGVIGNRLMAWLASVVFLAVFAFGNYGVIGNYNFITPYTATATYSFAGLLLVLWGLLKHLQTERRFWLGVAGLGLAVAYLDKPEGLLAAAGALGLYFLARGIRLARAAGGDGGRINAGRWLGQAATWLAGGFLALWLPVFAYFWMRQGPAFAFYATDYAIVSLWDNAIRDATLHAHLMQVYSGFDEPGKNFLFELWQGSWFAGLCAVMVVTSWGWARAPEGGVRWSILPMVAIGAGAGCAWFTYKGTDLGPEVVFPVCLAAWGFCAQCLWLAWRGGNAFSRSLGLAVVGTGASLMLAREILNARVQHYGFFMMPLAVLFWVQLLVVEASRPVEKQLRRNWLLPTLASLLALVCVGALLHTSLFFYNLKTYVVGEGRDRFYTFEPEAYTSGEYLHAMIEAVKKKAPAAKSLVAFPEGIAVNYHLRIRTPLRELEFNPLSLRYVKPAQVVQELQAHPPDAVLLYDRDFSEFGTSHFGADEASGQDIILWLKDRYNMMVMIGKSDRNVTGHAIDLLVPSGAAVPPPGSPQP